MNMAEVRETVPVNPSSPRRRILHVAISAYLNEIGFDSVEKVALETLVEMLQSFLTSIGLTAKAYCELTGRSEPLVGDVVMAFTELGISMDGIEKFARRSNRYIIPPLGTVSQPKQLSILQAGQKLAHPSHIPAHLPSFPDPHAYIRTPTHKQPVTEYEALREKAATQKRDVERALTRFVAKTGETHSLFLTDDTNLFPLIACKLNPKPYLDALLPRDQVFEEEEEEEIPTRRSKKEIIDNSESEAQTPPSSPPSSPQTPKQESPIPPAKPDKQESPGDQDPIDNPYLRPVKMPRKSKK